MVFYSVISQQSVQRHIGSFDLRHYCYLLHTMAKQTVVWLERKESKILKSMVLFAYKWRLPSANQHKTAFSKRTFFLGRRNGQSSFCAAHIFINVNFNLSLNRLTTKNFNLVTS